MSAGEGLTGAAELFEAEFRRQFADQRRGHFVRVAVEADGEEDHQNDKKARGIRKRFKMRLPGRRACRPVKLDLSR